MENDQEYVRSGHGVVIVYCHLREAPPCQSWTLNVIRETNEIVLIVATNCYALMQIL